MCEQMTMRSLHALLHAMIDALSHYQGRAQKFSLGEELRFARQMLESENEERVFRQFWLLALATQSTNLEEAPGIREVYAEIARVIRIGGILLPV